MIDALYISATGLRSQQEQIDVISNNVANMQTPGFKRARVNFVEMASPPQQGDEASASQRALHGQGARVLSTTTSFEAGGMKQTHGATDIAISGAGFFELEDADGTLSYTRAGQFKIDGEGYFTSADGKHLARAPQIPTDATDLQVSARGEVSVVLPDTAGRSVLGSIEIVSFASPEGLEQIGDNAFRATEKSGDAISAMPGEGNAGKLAQGYLESANVDMIDEMSSLVLAQRAYQLNARVLQASDQILETINNLRR